MHKAKSANDCNSDVAIKATQQYLTGSTVGTAVPLLCQMTWDEEILSESSPCVPRQIILDTEVFNLVKARLHLGIEQRHALCVAAPPRCYCS